ncbi:MAG TPA: Glu/Leu/Phe/Val dehydrogenase dimerization domain-containing protein [Actinomycetota bacterium]|nr:Glu/Leu/Phe/Val dehydrogenase dimerization domain-containing protein [Actinomycetota bacterium]
MNVFDHAPGFERVLFASDPAAGLRSIIAIHSTRLGPALGGTRCRPYATEEEALTDVLRLAEGMTWKAAAAGLDLGGGKAVIIADPQRDKTEALLRAYGRAVESLGGRYITSVDVGTTTPDLDEVRTQTRWVVGTSPFHGGHGDPSPFTAQGVANAIRSCLYHLHRDQSMAGRRVVIQGVGKVGQSLAGICAAEGAEVVVSDVDLDAVGRTVATHGVRTCTPDEALTTDCDVFAPCALGGVISSATIPSLSARIVCGAANNQLATPDDAQRLQDAGVLYAPDFIVNAGGLICVADELSGWNAARVSARVDRIGRTLLDVLHLASDRGLTTADAAVEYAKQRIRTLTSLVD